MWPRLCVVLLAACGSRVQAPSPALENRGAADRAVVRAEPPPADTISKHIAAEMDEYNGVSMPPTCSDAIAHREYIAPPKSDDVREREWLEGARINVLLHECDRGWSADLITCLADQDAWREDVVLDCIAYRMEDDARDALSKKLRSLEVLAAKIEEARKAPEKLDCDSVVAARYGDVMWKGKLKGVKADERDRLIKGSRKVMRDDCTRYAWSEATRACIVITGEIAPCLSDVWARNLGYPAAMP